MHKIKIEGIDYKYFRVGIGATKRIFFNRAAREAVGVSDPRNINPTKVFIDAVMSMKDPPPPKFQEVTDAETWSRVTRKFKN